MATNDAKRIRQRLVSLAEAGVRDLPRPLPVGAASGSIEGLGMDRPHASAQGGGDDSRPGDGGQTRSDLDVRRSESVTEAADRTKQLDLLRSEVAGCHRCEHLANSRSNTVFGSGDPSARFCFFGEAPGADEDASGEPFVGRAGQLLTKIIEACGLTRQEVFILNVLKCRPPGNRQPEPIEVANCRGYFERQFEVIQPEFIVCLGTTAAQSLLESQSTIGKLRGTWHRYRTANVLCTYHPSYLLRNPAAKRDVWNDMKLLLERAGLPVKDA